MLRDTVVKTGGITHAIGGIEDHVHLLIDAPKNLALSDLIKKLKVSSTHWVSSKDLKIQNFEWQTGFGAFSISLPTLDAVKQYILQQEEHHKTTSAKDEWNKLLLKRGQLS